MWFPRIRYNLKGSKVVMSHQLWLQSRHNERDGVSNHRRPNCLFNRLFRRRSKKISNLRVTGLCRETPPVTGGFSQRTNNVENVSIWWRHHSNILVKNTKYIWSFHPIYLKWTPQANYGLSVVFPIWSTKPVSPVIFRILWKVQITRYPFHITIISQVDHQK